MPRTRTRKTQKGLFTDDNMRGAVESVLKGASIRQVAKAHNFHHSTLARYVKKQKQSDTPLTRMTPNYSVRRVFTLEQENELVRYLVSCSKMFYGLPMNECRQIALEMALLNNITVPKSWHVKKMAGIDWMDGFRSRNPILSLMDFSCLIVPHIVSHSTPHTGNNATSVILLNKYFLRIPYEFHRRNISSNTKLKLVVTSCKNLKNVVIQMSR